MTPHENGFLFQGPKYTGRKVDPIMSVGFQNRALETKEEYKATISYIALENDFEDRVYSSRVGVITEPELEMRSADWGSTNSKWMVCLCVKLIGLRAVLHASSNSPFEMYCVRR
jgi:hypothetical protein